MTGNRGPTGSGQQAGQYAIRLGSHLDRRWAARFDGLALVHQPDGTTLLRGPVVDQAALHGLLQKVRDLGVPLVSVVQVEPAQPDEPTAASIPSHTPNGSTP